MNDAPFMKNAVNIAGGKGRKLIKIGNAVPKATIQRTLFNFGR